MYKYTYIRDLYHEESYCINSVQFWLKYIIHLLPVCSYSLTVRFFILIYLF